MRIVFAGTPAPAVPTLRALVASSHELVGVVTRPDAPLGRKRVMTPSPVAAAAADADLPVLKTSRLDAAATDVIRGWEPDVGVIVAYGGLVREPLLSDPRDGWINLHFSLLPRWRGAAPVQHALIAGDRETGASVFRLVPALDAGDVFEEVAYPVPPEATAGDVLDTLSHRGAEVVLRVVDALAAGTAQATAQQGAPTLAPKLTIVDGRLDFSETADRVFDRYRGTTPEPGAHTFIGGQRLKILAARLGRGLEGAQDALQPGELALRDGKVHVGCQEGSLELIEVQPAGKGAMRAGDWWRGVRQERLHADPIDGEAQ